MTVLAGPEGSKVGYSGHTVNVSGRGLRVKVRAPLADGDQVEVLSVDGPKYPVRSRVVWVGKVGTEERGQAGLEFLTYCPTNFWENP